MKPGQGSPFDVCSTYSGQDRDYCESLIGQCIEQEAPSSAGGGQSKPIDLSVCGGQKFQFAKTTVCGIMVPRLISAYGSCPVTSRQKLHGMEIDDAAAKALVGAGTPAIVVAANPQDAKLAGIARGIAGQHAGERIFFVDSTNSAAFMIRLMYTIGVPKGMVQQAVRESGSTMAFRFDGKAWAIQPTAATAAPVEIRPVVPAPSGPAEARPAAPAPLDSEVEQYLEASVYSAFFSEVVRGKIGVIAKKHRFDKLTAELRLRFRITLDGNIEETAEATVSIEFQKSGTREPGEGDFAGMKSEAARAIMACFPKQVKLTIGRAVAEKMFVVIEGSDIKVRNEWTFDFTFPKKTAVPAPAEAKPAAPAEVKPAVPGGVIPIQIIPVSPVPGPEARPTAPAPAEAKPAAPAPAEAKPAAPDGIIRIEVKPVAPAPAEAKPAAPAPAEAKPGAPLPEIRVEVKPVAPAPAEAKPAAPAPAEAKPAAPLPEIRVEVKPVAPAPAEAKPAAPAPAEAKPAAPLPEIRVEVKPVAPAPAEAKPAAPAPAEAKPAAPAPAEAKPAAPAPAEAKPAAPAPAEAKPAAPAPAEAKPAAPAPAEAKPAAPLPEIRVEVKPVAPAPAEAKPAAPAPAEAKPAAPAPAEAKPAAPAPAEAKPAAPLPEIRVEVKPVAPAPAEAKPAAPAPAEAKPAAPAPEAPEAPEAPAEAKPAAPLPEIRVEVKPVAPAPAEAKPAAPAPAEAKPAAPAPAEAKPAAPAPAEAKPAAPAPAEAKPAAPAPAEAKPAAPAPAEAKPVAPAPAEAKPAAPLPEIRVEVKPVVPAPAEAKPAAPAPAEAKPAAPAPEAPEAPEAPAEAKPAAPLPEIRVEVKPVAPAPAEAKPAAPAPAEAKPAAPAPAEAKPAAPAPAEAKPAAPAPAEAKPAVPAPAEAKPAAPAPAEVKPVAPAPAEAKTAAPAPAAAARPAVVWRQGISTMSEEVQRYFEREVIPRFISDDVVARMRALIKPDSATGPVKIAFGFNAVRADDKPITAPVTMTVSIDFRETLSRVNPETNDFVGMERAVAVRAMALLPTEVTMTVPVEIAKKIFPAERNAQGRVVESSIDRFEFDCVLQGVAEGPASPALPAAEADDPGMVPLVPVGSRTPEAYVRTIVMPQLMGGEHERAIAEAGKPYTLTDTSKILLRLVITRPAGEITGPVRAEAQLKFRRSNTDEPELTDYSEIASAAVKAIMAAIPKKIPITIDEASAKMLFGSSTSYQLDLDYTPPRTQ